MNGTPKSFCPQCTTEWDRPWYDICPHCNYRFKGHPWWQAPSIIVALICLPAVLLAAYGILASVYPGLYEGRNLESFAFDITLFGTPVGAIAAAVILTIRTGRKGAAIAGWSLLWAVVFSVVSLMLCFFSCLYAFNR